MSLVVALRDRWIPHCRVYPYTILGLMLIPILSIAFWSRYPADWEKVYVTAAARMTAGESIFNESFVYPPINAWLSLPGVYLGPVPARILWLVVNAAALAALVWGAWRLSGGGRLEEAHSVPRREHQIFVIGLLCAVCFALDALTNQQTDVIVAALVVIGCVASVRKRDWSAGALIGLAAAIKCTPLLMACYLAWRRRWTSALLIPVVAVAVNFIPDLTHPRDASTPRLQEWAQRHLLPMADRQHDFGSWACAVSGNHSLGGLTRRLLVFEGVWSEKNLVAQLRLDRVAPQTLKAVSSSLMVLLVVAALACSWKAGRVAHSVGSPPSPGPSREALEFGLVLILMVLFSPQSSKPHFCTLLLPAFCLARAGLGSPNRLLATLVPVVVVCGLMSNKDLVGKFVYDHILWYGVVTLNACLLFAGCCIALIDRRRAASALPKSSDSTTLDARHAA